MIFDNINYRYGIILTGINLSIAVLSIFTFKGLTASSYSGSVKEREEKTYYTIVCIYFLFYCILYVLGDIQWYINKSWTALGLEDVFWNTVFLYIYFGMYYALKRIKQRFKL